MALGNQEAAEILKAFGIAAGEPPAVAARKADAVGPNPPQFGPRPQFGNFQGLTQHDQGLNLASLLNSNFVNNALGGASNLANKTNSAYDLYGLTSALRAQNNNQLALQKYQGDQGYDLGNRQLAANYNLGQGGLDIANINALGGLVGGAQDYRNQADDIAHKAYTADRGFGIIENVLGGLNLGGQGGQGGQGGYGGFQGRDAYGNIVSTATPGGYQGTISPNPVTEQGNINPAVNALYNPPGSPSQGALQRQNYDALAAAGAQGANQLAREEIPANRMNTLGIQQGQFGQGQDLASYLTNLQRERAAQTVRGAQLGSQVLNQSLNV